MAQLSQVSFAYPGQEYSADISDIERRRKLAEALQAQSLQPIETQMAGGMAVPISPWQGAAKLAQGLIAGKTAKSAEDRQRELSARIQGDVSTDTRLLAEALEGGKPIKLSPGEQVQASEYGPPNIQTEPMAPRDAIMQALPQMRTPMGQQMAQGYLLSNLKQEEKFGHTPQIEMVNGQPHAVLYGDKGTRKVVAPVNPRDKFNTQTADTQAQLSQAQQHWNGLSENQRQQLGMEAARLGVSVQQLILERANAANRGIETQFTTGSGVIPGMPSLPQVPQVPAMGGSMMAQPQAPAQQQPLPVAQPPAPLPRMPASPQAGPQAAPNGSRITPKQRSEIEAARPQQTKSAQENLSKLDLSVHYINELLNDADGMNRITGSFMGRTPNVTNAATTAQANLDTLKSQIGVEVLTAMREASKTGGAVGNVTEKEWPILQNQLAALQQSQDTSSFTRNLRNLKMTMEGMKQRIREAYERNYGAMTYEPMKLEQARPNQAAQGVVVVDW